MIVSMQDREFTPIDRLLAGFGNALRTVATAAGQPARRNPAADVEDGPLDDKEKAHAAGLMRVNHAGEVAAQGLYQGHALVARDRALEAELKQAASEEFDHLAWCEQRLVELDAKPSALIPLWYAGSYAIGAASGLLGDRWSLGFIAETESQVCEHLESHFDRLPEGDHRSQAIVRQMHAEEAEHGANAVQAGAARLPPAVIRLMRMTARLMTTTAYRL